MSVILRVIIGGLVAAAIGVALVPLLIILDIREGGSGWGLCKEGLSGCRTTYFAGFEAVAVFIVVLASILALIALGFRLLRGIEKRRVRREMELTLGLQPRSLR